jgi:hypothetical protein
MEAKVDAKAPTAIPLSVATKIPTSEPRLKINIGIPKADFGNNLPVSRRFTAVGMIAIRRLNNNGGDPVRTEK